MLLIVLYNFLITTNKNNLDFLLNLVVTFSICFDNI